MSPKEIKLPKGYKPTDAEEYMCDKQLEYFKQKLIQWREDLRAESQNTVDHLKQENWNESDLNDRASVEVEAAMELKTRDRYRKLINKINAAIGRIEDGTYGFCEETGDPIGIKRLEARPIATMTIEAQERHERFERSHSED